MEVEKRGREKRKKERGEGERGVGQGLGLLFHCPALHVSILESQEMASTAGELRVA